MPFQKYPNLTEEGFNPFENLSEKLNRNRDEFFDGFLMGDLGLGRKTDQTGVEEALGRYPEGVANKNRFQIHGILTSCA